MDNKIRQILFAKKIQGILAEKTAASGNRGANKGGKGGKGGSGGKGGGGKGGKGSGGTSAPVPTPIVVQNPRALWPWVTGGATALGLAGTTYAATSGQKEIGKVTTDAAARQADEVFKNLPPLKVPDVAPQKSADKTTKGSETPSKGTPNKTAPALTTVPAPAPAPVPASGASAEPTPEGSEIPYTGIGIGGGSGLAISMLYGKMRGRPDLFRDLLATLAGAGAGAAVEIGMNSKA